MTSPITYSHHLVALTARAQAANARLAGADPDRRAARVAVARPRAAALSVWLDGSPLEESTAADVDAGRIPLLEQPPTPVTGGWARALQLDAMETQEVAAVEYANLRRVEDVEHELAAAALAHPLDTLGRLHGIISQGLVLPEVIGRYRVTEQAVHDGTQGMMIYSAAAPETVPAAMAELGTWISRRAITVPPVILAGVVHERLLELQPFEAGNGRVARAFTRILLVASGIDTHGAAVLEQPLADDAGAYYAEVAATLRRQGDLTRWLERHTAAVALALETAADAVDPEPRPAPPERGRPTVEALPPRGELTVRDYATRVGVDLRTAMADLHAFVRAGELVDLPGGGGLRFARPAEQPDRG